MKNKIQNVRQWIWLYLFLVGIIFAEILGKILDHNAATGCSGVLLAALSLVILLAAVPVSAFLAEIFAGRVSTVRIDGIPKRRSCFFCFWILCFICWVPVWLAYWPALLNYDTYNQMSQNISDWYSMQHPLVHTKLLGFFYWLGTQVFQSVNAGFACYAAFQMAILSGSIAYAIDYLYRKNVKTWICGLVLLWACLWPTHPILAISTTKDVIFSAIFLLIFILSLEWLEAEKRWPLRKQVGYMLLLVLLMLFRKNGIYAVVLFEAGLLAVWIFRRKREAGRKLIRMILVILLGIILYQGASFTISHMLHAASGSRLEALSVPIQQVARTYLVHEEDITDADKVLITALIPEDVLETYKEHLSDPLKDEADVTVLNEHMSEYLDLYLRLGKAHPKIYLEAFLYSTEGYWYPDDVSHAQIYGWGDGRRNAGYLGTSMAEVEQMENVVQKSLLPGLEQICEKIATDNVHQQWPVVSYLFVPAFYVWMIVLGAVFMILKKQTALLPVLFLTLGYFATVLLGPCCLIRYAYPLVLCAPVILVASLAEPEKRK